LHPYVAYATRRCKSGSWSKVNLGAAADRNGPDSSGLEEVQVLTVRSLPSAKGSGDEDGIRASGLREPVDASGKIQEQEVSARGQMTFCPRARADDARITGLLVEPPDLLG
jgi:hypothetical protein